MIEQFLIQFYDCLHFSKEKAFQAERFADLFAEHAILIEHMPDGFQPLTIQEFITNMNAYQNCMSGSFEEIQTGCQIVNEEGILIVDCAYEKKIDDKITTGINHMIIAENKGKLKIISIVF